MDQIETDFAKSGMLPPCFRQSGELCYAPSEIRFASGERVATMTALHTAAASGWIPVIAAIALSACTTVKLEGGDKPIEVNLNVKIDQEVRVKLDREIETLIAENPNIF